MNKLQPLKPMPPRQFPKQQYQKLGYHIWALNVGIIIIVILVGMLLITATRPTNHPVTHNIKSARSIRKPTPRHIKHSSRPLNITPTRGKKLLGHWLIKLHYSSNKYQEALINFQNSNQRREKALSRRLTNHQPKQIEKLINHNLIK